MTYRTQEQLERIEQMQAMRVYGYDISEIGRYYNLSRERVRQLIGNLGHRFYQTPKKKINKIIRFWEHVEVGFPDECWIFKGKPFPTGYGSARMGKIQGSHKIAYFIAHGEIPKGLWILHTCDNRLCCNPAHLYAGTPKNNADDRAERSNWNPRSRLSTELVVKIKQMLLDGISQTKISKDLQIEYVTINRIAKGHSYKDVDVFDPDQRTHKAAILDTTATEPAYQLTDKGREAITAQPAPQPIPQVRPA